MSTVQDTTKCPQCGYQEADVLFDCRDSSEDLMCRRCGYREYSGPDLDENGHDRGWKHEVNKGFGVLECRDTSGIEAIYTLHTEEEVVDAERFLREQLSKGEVTADTAYLSKWNENTKQVELALGTFYEWPKGRNCESPYADADDPIEVNESSEGDSFPFFG